MNFICTWSSTSLLRVHCFIHLGAMFFFVCELFIYIYGTKSTFPNQDNNDDNKNNITLWLTFYLCTVPSNSKAYQNHFICQDGLTHFASRDVIDWIFVCSSQCIEGFHLRLAPVGYLLINDWTCHANTNFAIIFPSSEGVPADSVWTIKNSLIRTSPVLFTCLPELSTSRVSCQKGPIGHS